MTIAEVAEYLPQVQRGSVCEPTRKGKIQVRKGRYSQVQVDESLEPVLVHPSKETGPIETDEMSQGTLDQIYLAARLALCDILFGEARPPLLMDDPFVKFDPERRSAALELCRELSSDRQILLFTCHDGYDQYASSVIDLPAPD